jgi:hypothetical protein
MLREPRQIEKVEKAAPLRTDSKKGRFRLVKLEERIAPSNSGKKHGGGHHHGGL